LGGEYRLPRVACSVQADYNTVTHQLIVSDPFNRYQIFEPRSLISGAERDQGKEIYDSTEIHGVKME
jgi:hypothetical protein